MSTTQSTATRRHDTGRDASQNTTRGTEPVSVRPIPLRLTWCSSLSLRATLDGLAGVAMADRDREIRETAMAALIAAGRDGVAALMERS